MSKQRKVAIIQIGHSYWKVSSITKATQVVMALQDAELLERRWEGEEYIFRVREGRYGEGDISMTMANPSNVKPKYLALPGE